MSFLFVPLIEDIPPFYSVSPDLFENCHINPEVIFEGKSIKYCKGVFDEKSANIECIFKYSQLVRNIYGEALLKIFAEVYLVKNLQIWNALRNTYYLT